MTIQEAKLEARRKALDSLARYKFMMFGYHAALWVSLNRLDTHKADNPFTPFVTLARQMEGGKNELASQTLPSPHRTHL